MAQQILVGDSLAPEGLEYLKSTGFAFDNKVGLKEAELAAIVGSYDALIVRSGAKVTAKVLENPGKLKAIARAGVGVDNIDLEAATSKGILVMNTAEASTLSTAEHALALMMSLARKIPQAHQSPRPIRTMEKDAASTRHPTWPAKRWASSAWAESAAPSPPAPWPWR
jgi:D-3-phosphoglycerate dehydrogenase